MAAWGGGGGVASFKKGTFCYIAYYWKTSQCVYGTICYHVRDYSEHNNHVVQIRDDDKNNLLSTKMEIKMHDIWISILKPHSVLA